MFHVATRSVLLSGACALRATRAVRQGNTRACVRTETGNGQSVLSLCGVARRGQLRTDPPNENHATTTSKAKPAVGTARGIPVGRLGGFSWSSIRCDPSPSPSPSSEAPIPRLRALENISGHMRGPWTRGGYDERVATARRAAALQRRGWNERTSSFCALASALCRVRCNNISLRKVTRPVRTEESLYLSCARASDSRRQPAAQAAARRAPRLS